MLRNNIIRRLEIFVNFVIPIITSTIQHIIERKSIVLVKLIVNSGVHNCKGTFIHTDSSGSVIHFIA